MRVYEAYAFLSEELTKIYDHREASIISRYLIEDLFELNFASEIVLTSVQEIILNKSCNRLLSHEPWQYIGGFADFYGYKFIVNSDVLIPRPETEELVYNALKIIKQNNLRTVIDIGSGSGIIPITLSLKSKLEKVVGVDISNAALNVCTKNNKKHSTLVEFVQIQHLYKFYKC